MVFVCSTERVCSYAKGPPGPLERPTSPDAPPGPLDRPTSVLVGGPTLEARAEEFMRTTGARAALEGMAVDTRATCGVLDVGRFGSWSGFRETTCGASAGAGATMSDDCGALAGAGATMRDDCGALAGAGATMGDVREIPEALRDLESLAGVAEPWMCA